MAGTERTASITWEGGLIDGSGEIVSTGSGAFGGLPVTWAARTETPDGKTSPEELLAAAHATCYAMGLSYGLANDGHPPKKLDIVATCSLEMTGSGPKVAAMHFNVNGDVDGIDAAAFEQAAQAAAESCPVSGAITGNVAISVDASLA